jgi:hypothetical protein
LVYADQSGYIACILIGQITCKCVLSKSPAVACPGLGLYVRSFKNKIQYFWSSSLAGPSIFALTKKFPKNTKENFPLDHFCSHLSQDGEIDLPFPKTCILSTFDAIMAMAIMASNSHIVIWPLWHQRWQLWGFTETLIKMWQSGEDRHIDPAQPWKNCQNQIQQFLKLVAG